MLRNAIQGFEEIADVKIVQAGLYLYGLVPLLKASAKREVREVLSYSVL